MRSARLSGLVSIQLTGQMDDRAPLPQQARRAGGPPASGWMLIIAWDAERDAL